MKLLLITLLVAMGLPFGFQVIKRKLPSLGGVPSLFAYMILCGAGGVIEATFLADGDLIVAAVCGIGIFLISQGFYGSVLSKFLPGRSSIG